MNTIRNKTAVKVLACYIAAALFVIATVEKSFAGFSPSRIIQFSSAEREADLEKVRSALETKVVAEKLKQLGFSKDEIQGRLGQLSDQQLHKLAVRAEELKVGGDAGGVIIAVLVIAILVVLFVYIFKRV